jgi:hypothetical protein
MRFSFELSGAATGGGNPANMDITFSCYFLDAKQTKHQLVPPSPAKKYHARQRFLVRKEQLAQVRAVIY